MNVAAGSHAEASLKRGGEVGDDVAKHVVGDDDIKVAGLADHLKAESVNVHVFRGNLRKFLGNFFEGALPETASVGHGV